MLMNHSINLKNSYIILLAISARISVKEAKNIEFVKCDLLNEFPGQRLKENDTSIIKTHFIIQYSQNIV